MALSIDWISEENTALLTPHDPLTSGASYTLRVLTTVSDLAGNHLAEEYLLGFTVSLCGNGVVEAYEECDLGAFNDICSTCTETCLVKPENYCGDGILCTPEQCEIGQELACALVLGIPDALGTAPCADDCSGYRTDGNCTRTHLCPPKPEGTLWNSVSDYLQTWNGTTWVPATDTTTDYDPESSTTSCRFTCPEGEVWSGVTCVTQPVGCGNGTLDAGEQCDDANTNNADSCKNDCTLNICGDGVTGGPVPALLYDFESGTIPSDAVNGNPGWEITTVQKHAGAYSIRSSAIGNNANATITFTGLSDGNICYWRTGSSETGYDFLTVAIDGVQKESLSGLQQTWTQMCWSVTPGTHTIRFRYTKDEYVAENWDRWYIDDLRFSAGIAEECDDGNAIDTDACKNDCTNNVCGDGVVLAGIETCDTIATACSTLLGDPQATGTAPCNTDCTGYEPVGNCTKTYTCPAKPATGTVWNTVSSYPQTWDGSGWTPAADLVTEYDPTASTTECRFTCAFNYEWDGSSCVTDDFLAETIAQISKQSMSDTVYYLASATCNGRNNNTTGSTNARTHIIDRMTAIGLNAGGANGSWVQSFSNYYCNYNWVTGNNVIGFLEGSHSTYKNEYLVIGAHYDHLGTTGSTYYPGADDNASGVAMMLEIAAALKRIQAHLARSVVFIAFDAEEDGLCGSKYYTANPRYPLNQTVYMLNLDMVGYLRNNAIELTDSYGSTWADTTLSTLADKYGLGETFESCGYDCSDHAPFSDKNIPDVMVTTGLEDVYHQTTDTADLINYDGMVTVASYLTEFSYEVTVHLDPFFVPLFPPIETPLFPTVREFRDHGVLPPNTPRD